MTKLQDLPEQELADLLGLPLVKARTWLKVAQSVAEDPPWLEDWFGDFESATSLRRSSVKDLMELPVEEVKRLKKTGEFYRRYPYFKRKAPTDAKTRLKYLRDLLRDEVEFEARYPAAYELLFERSRAISGLPLPSFDVRVLRNDPQGSVLPAGWFQDWKRSQDSGDAFSVTFERREDVDKEVDQRFAPLDLGHVRGVLLAILSREEYAERVATELHDEAVREELGAPALAQVRLTDLRLATAPELGDTAALKKTVRPLLASLKRPITPNQILRWKWDLLWEGEETRGQQSEEERRKIVRVSFSAAALLLFLDFDMPDIEGASSLRLATHVGELAQIIRILSKSLDANARKLQKLLAYRDQHRPPTPGQQFYDALVDYRMGKEPHKVANGLGMRPYKSSPSKAGGDDWGGTRGWKSRLEERLEQGARIEEEKYPRAASVFRHRDRPRIARKARLAYRAYEEETGLRPEEEYSPWPRVGQRIRVSASTDWGLEVIEAYVQLGSCLKRGLKPFPTHSDFDT